MIHHMLLNSLYTESGYSLYVSNRSLLKYIMKVQQHTGVKRRKVSAQYSKYYYIPIFETLKVLLNHEDVLQEVLNSHQSFDTVLRDMCDG